MAKRFTTEDAEMSMVEDFDGEYVLYADYAKLDSRLTNAKFEIERLHDALKALNEMINP